MTTENPELATTSICTECEASIQADKDNRQLQIACECDNRDIRVKTALPGHWQL